jgi:hypothetical protein
MTGLAEVRRDYRVAFLRFLDHGEESALTTGYELGRRALASGMPLLDLARVHHEVVVEVLAGSDAGPGADPGAHHGANPGAHQGADPVRVAEAASAFLLEVLAPYEMSRRSADRPR